MSGTTIREVLIRVGIENGEMKLAAPDMSAWKAAMEEMRKDMEAITQIPMPIGSRPGASGAKAALEDIQSTAQGIPGSQSSAKAAMDDIQSSAKAASQEVDSLNQKMHGGSPVSIGMPGYGASVVNRASSKASESIGQMHDAGALEGFTDDDLAKLQSQLEKKAAMLIREQDREAAAAERSATQSAKAEENDAKTAFDYRKSFYERRESAATAEALKQEKERQNVTRLTPDDRDMIRSYSKIMKEKASAAKAVRDAEDEKASRRSSWDQQTSDISVAAKVKETAEAKKKLAAESTNAFQSSVQLARGLSQLGAATGIIPGEMLHTVVAIEGLVNIARAGEKAFSAFGIGGIALGSGLAVLAGELLLTKHAFDESRASARAYYESITDDASRSLGYISSGATRHHSQATHAAMSATYTGAAERFLPNFARYESRERAIRGVESSDIRSEFKSSFRQRTEHRGGLEEQRTAAEDEIKFKKDQLEKLKAADVKLLQERKNIEGSTRNAIESARQEAVGATYETGYGYSFRQLQKPGRAIGGFLGFNTGIDRNSGYLNSQAQAKEAAEVRGDEARRDGETKILGINNTIEESLQKQRDFAKDINQLEQTRLTTTKEIRQSTYAALQTEKERVRGANIGFGSQSVGEQHRILRMQKKHDEIEAKRAANIAAGLPEDQGLPQYSQFEMQHGGGGSVAEDSMRRQALRTAKKEGYRPENDLTQLGKEHDEEMAKNVVAQMKQDVADSVERFKDAGQRMADIVAAKMPIQELVAAFEKQLNERLAANRINDQIRQKTFGQ